MNETYRIDVPYQEDRERLILALANSGYKVWVTEHEPMGKLQSGFTVSYQAI